MAARRGLQGMDSIESCCRRAVHGREPGGVDWQGLCQCTRFETCHSLRIRSSWRTGCLLRRTGIAWLSWGIHQLNGCPLYLDYCYYFSETLGADELKPAAADSDEFCNNISLGRSYQISKCCSPTLNPRAFARRTRLVGSRVAPDFALLAHPA